jgi:hypothetical protein
MNEIRDRNEYRSLGLRNSQETALLYNDRSADIFEGSGRSFPVCGASFALPAAHGLTLNHLLIFLLLITI